MTRDRLKFLNKNQAYCSFTEFNAVIGLNRPDFEPKWEDSRCMVTFLEGELMQTNTDAIALDVRGLPPPEPLEHVLEALGILDAAQQLRVLIDREPFPLYEILAQNGFLHHTRNTEDYRYEVLIWHKP